MKEELMLNEFEQFFTKSQIKRLSIMFIVPLISIGLTLLINQFSFIWSSVIGGIVYCLYTPLIINWSNNYKKTSTQYENV